MYATDHQMYGSWPVLVAQSIMPQGEQALSWYENFLSANPETFKLLIVNPIQESRHRK